MCVDCCADSFWCKLVWWDLWPELVTEIQWLSVQTILTMLKARKLVRVGGTRDEIAMYSSQQPMAITFIHLTTAPLMTHILAMCPSTEHNWRTTKSIPYYVLRAWNSLFANGRFMYIYVDVSMPGRGVFLELYYPLLIFTQSLYSGICSRMAVQRDTMAKVMGTPVPWQWWGDGVISIIN